MISPNVTTWGGMKIRIQGMEKLRNTRNIRGCGTRRGNCTSLTFHPGSRCFVVDWNDPRKPHRKSWLVGLTLSGRLRCGPPNTGEDPASARLASTSSLIPGEARVLHSCTTNARAQPIPRSHGEIVMSAKQPKKPL